MEDISILSACTSGGCGAKIGPDTLKGILNELPKYGCEQLLVGYESSDDAAVYQMDEENCIISTVDFFSPIVNNAYDFGQIAAANALSDIYAMGGKVLFGLNIVCFPEKLPKEMLKDILKGGLDKMTEAGGYIAGGHSIFDMEPKYGISVTGTAKKDKILRNDTPKVSHSLILTKKLGVGITMSAYRNGVCDDDAFNEAVNGMKHLNRYASEKMQKYNVSACTDVTGFGLLSHLLEMCSDTVSANIFINDLPIIEKALTYAKDGYITSAGARNRRNFDNFGSTNGLLPEIAEILFDPQTSGGLLICVDTNDANNLLKDLQDTDPNARIIGNIVEKSDKIVNFIV